MLLSQVLPNDVEQTFYRSKGRRLIRRRCCIIISLIIIICPSQMMFVARSRRSTGAILRCRNRSGTTATRRRGSNGGAFEFIALLFKGLEEVVIAQQQTLFSAMVAGWSIGQLRFLVPAIFQWAVGWVSHGHLQMSVGANFDRWAVACPWALKTTLITLRLRNV